MKEILLEHLYHYTSRWKIYFSTTNISAIIIQDDFLSTLFLERKKIKKNETY